MVGDLGLGVGDASGRAPLGQVIHEDGVGAHVGGVGPGAGEAAVEAREAGARVEQAHEARPLTREVRRQEERVVLPDHAIGRVGTVEPVHADANHRVVDRAKLLDGLVGLRQIALDPVRRTAEGTQRVLDLGRGRLDARKREIVGNLPGVTGPEEGNLGVCHGVPNLLVAELDGSAVCRSLAPTAASRRAARALGIGPQAVRVAGAATEPFGGLDAEDFSRKPRQCRSGRSGSGCRTRRSCLRRSGGLRTRCRSGCRRLRRSVGKPVPRRGPPRGTPKRRRRSCSGRCRYRRKRRRRACTPRCRRNWPRRLRLRTLRRVHTRYRIAAVGERGLEVLAAEGRACREGAQTRGSARPVGADLVLSTHVAAGSTVGSIALDVGSIVIAARPRREGRYVRRDAGALLLVAEFAELADGAARSAVVEVGAEVGARRAACREGAAGWLAGALLAAIARRTGGATAAAVVIVGHGVRQATIAVRVGCGSRKCGTHAVQAEVAAWATFPSEPQLLGSVVNEKHARQSWFGSPGTSRCRCRRCRPARPRTPRRMRRTGRKH